MDAKPYYTSGSTILLPEIARAISCNFPNDSPTDDNFDKVIV